jgi:hypothetical protein
VLRDYLSCITSHDNGSNPLPEPDYPKPEQKRNARARHGGAWWCGTAFMPESQCPCHARLKRASSGWGTGERHRTIRPYKRVASSTRTWSGFLLIYISDFLSSTFCSVVRGSDLVFVSLTYGSKQVNEIAAGSKSPANLKIDGAKLYYQIRADGTWHSKEKHVEFK